MAYASHSMHRNDNIYDMVECNREEFNVCMLFDNLLARGIASYTATAHTFTATRTKQRLLT
eukprot:CAMPEP_0201721210 /NCGR_PEP_ID=MMETSP0593-20130828/5922_1 /ASSEMBLY_ACC=CAM_ASM_000672 /TAXON_ID=267983 /ORGANISM="Skeletonema japonicum, Strain CCMP2506" /LENGTH=60 /DNA_ID=CAMNT_0048211959 /DNA_START=177 /DNA_END=359 /DNA_ORIENTATION=+